MNISLAEKSGFCFGVKRAVEIAEKESNAYLLGELIHNNYVLQKLADNGMKIAKNIDELPENCACVIRAHGEKKEIYKKLADKNIKCIDATCPKVKNIHKIVEENFNLGKNIVIFGKKDHPEVQGINGYCENEAIIIDNENFDFPPNACLVSQTTMGIENWEKLKKTTKDDTIIYNTICSATEGRQIAAKRQAQSSDAMLVIGSNSSSNTKRLYEICKATCENTFLIENASELPMEKLSKFQEVGITAGASTPLEIIQEVIKTMTEENQNVQAESSSFEQELEKSLAPLYSGQVVSGTVIAVTPTEIAVDLGFKYDGFISDDELSFDDGVQTKSVAKVGDQIEAFVVRVNDKDGLVQLSLKKIEAIKRTEAIVNATETKEIIEGKVIKAVNGGIIVNCSDVRVFVPASQSGTSKDANLEDLVGTKVKLRILEADKRMKKVVGSIKLASGTVKTQAKKEFWDSAAIGSKYKGTVKTITPFGAFVDLGGIDGLVHLSELSWNNIKSAEEVVKIGDEIEVSIKSLDQENNKISLSFKNPNDNPWIKIKNAIQAGDTINVKIARLVPFGAFAEVAPNVDGLIHISELDVKNITNPASVVKIGDEIEVKVLELDAENEKLSLSRAALMEGYVEKSRDLTLE